MSDREQFVDFDNNKSSTQKIECGVPQGSILGPLLYLIYVNDIATCTHGNILSFADDTALFLSDSNLGNLFTNANVEVNKLFNWFCANRLSLNPTKTKALVISNSNNPVNSVDQQLYINGTPLTQIGSNFHEKSTKFLGLHLDDILSWKHHLAHINRKISYALFMIKQVKHFLPANSLKTLYYALIHPHLSYGILAWGNANSSILKKTEILQKRAIRTINRANYNSHTEPLFKKCGILKLNDLYESQVALFMRDYVSNILPMSFDKLYHFNYEIQKDHETRQSNQMYIQRCNSAFAGKLPLYKFPLIWNKWCNVLPNISSRSHFKKQLTKCIISSYSNSVNCSNKICTDCFRT